MTRARGGLAVFAAILVLGFISGSDGQSLGSAVQADVQAWLRSRTEAHRNLTRFSFGVYSDIHMSEDAIAVLTRATWATLLRQWRDAGHAFGLIVGDLGYGNPGDPANVLSGPATVPNAPMVFYTMGNHELDRIGKRAWIDALYPGSVAPGSWTQAAGLAPGNSDHVYYSFDIGPSTHFIVLDGDHMTFDGVNARVWQAFGQKQLAWLAAEIAANPMKNLMLFVHEPIDQQVTGSTPEYTLNDKGGLIDLLAAHPKQAVIFSGHLHSHSGVTRWRGITSVHVQTSTPGPFGIGPTYGVNVYVDGETINILNAGTLTNFDQHPMNAVQLSGQTQVVTVAEDGENNGISRVPGMSITAAENGVAPTFGTLMLKTGAIWWYATRFISEQLIKIRPGMKLSYDMWLSNVNAGNDAVAVQPNWYMKDGTLPPKVFDQNGLALSQRPRDGKFYLFNDDLPRLNGLATNRWYHREFDLSALAGNYVDGVYLGAAAGRVDVGSVYVDNIRFTWPATADMTPPIVTASATVSGSTAQIAAIASDNIGVAGVQFLLDGAHLGVEDTLSPYSLSFDTTPLANGLHTLQARARDAAGNTALSPNVTINVGNGSSTAINVALAANGGTATASSSYSAAYGPSGVNNGDRRGLAWGAGGGWSDGTTSAYPDWLQIDFNGSKAITEIDVFSVQDTYAAPMDPTASLAFTQYGLRDFEVQYWNGTAWVTVTGGSVTGNTLVWRQFTFAAVTTTKIRVLVTQALAGHSRLAEIEAYGTSSAPPPSVTNVALTANGGTATASSSYNAAYGPGGVNNGDRRGFAWGAGGGWSDGTASAYPDWLQIDFNGSKAITEIDVFSLQDAYTAPVDPTASLTFTQYGLRDFEVQYWNGIAWVTVTGGSVTGNTSVWRQFTFAAVTTTKIRVLITQALAGHSRLAEVEAYGTSSASLTNVALTANGGTATASSSYNAAYGPSGVNNGDRRGFAWGAGGGWSDGTASAYPDWLQIDFNGSKAITKIDVFSLQDTYAAPVDPTASLTFTQYGLRDFEVQYWNGTAWVTVTGGSVTGNTLVWREFTFAAVTTTKIRVLVTQALAGYSRLAEVEAYGQ